MPLLWIWIGSLIQCSRGAQHVEGSTAAILFVGILVSYVIILMIAGAIQARGQATSHGPDPLPLEPQHARRAATARGPRS